MKFKEQLHGDGTRSMLFECPGCKFLHVVYVGGPNRPTWSFNGYVDKPTVSPSVLVSWEQDGKPKVCHSFIKDGRIEFLSDCTHDLAGQTVEIPEWEA
ncbi:DUF6527 family protein [Caballeronia cordobensis]|uniref:DUF6527 family protein n=1 Tax=Caballeronia cordobensis TaxID=1353886 RepID=UPI00045EE2EB|nr:putative membrane protein [Burkholderia sp. RPE67]